MKILLSFLGKGRSDIQTGYRTANYEFAPDFVRSVPFFGLALAEYVQPEKLVLVGTRGSMWDVFFEQQGVPDDDLLALIEAVSNEQVSEILLDRFEPLLAAKIGRPVQCLLIPYATTTDEQAAILHRLASEIAKDDEVVLDVTHGFRHLPMLALVAAQYLKHVRQVTVSEIYYGALEMTPKGGNTPVLRLGGLLQMMAWNEALATYGKDGDYSVFADLLQQDGMNPAQTAQLKQAAFFERSSNPVNARQRLANVFSQVVEHTGTLGVLFQKALSERIRWFRQQTRDEWELALADEYLQRGDYLRAVTYLFEAAVTRATLQEGANISDFDARKAALKVAKENMPALKRLEYLRNSLAHGVRPRDDQEIRAMQNEESLRTHLTELRRKLFH